MDREPLLPYLMATALIAGMASIIAVSVVIEETRKAEQRVTNPWTLRTRAEVP